MPISETARRNHAELFPKHESTLKAMDATGMRRLTFIGSMGIYDEIPGQRQGAILDPYRRAAAIIEGSDLDYRSQRTVQTIETSA